MERPARLQLVGGVEASAPMRPPDLRRSQAAVARENVLASVAAIEPAALSPHDPRWVLAASARSQLQGAVLTPERREKLVRMGTSLGLRRFDASVVIALVQDEARRAQPTESLVEKLRTNVVSPSECRAAESDRSRCVWRWASAIACAVAANAFAIWWLLGAR